MNLAVIGYGYWGPNLVRNFFNTENSTVIIVADARRERLKIINGIFPTIHTTSNIEEIFKNELVDAVVIATPVSTHYALAKKALESGKHVLIEKPMTRSSFEAKELIDLANKQNKLLMVDHTFLYTGAVQKMKELIVNGDIGNINYFDSTRINLGLFQPDMNVLWDLAPHDISILNYLVDEEPYSVNATGVSHTKNGLENIAYMTINYKSGLIAHFNCSWSSPVKIRTTLVGGDKKMILYNDIEPTEKIKVYDTGYSVRTDEEKQKILVDYRAGDVFIPKLSMQEALAGMAKDFISSIENGSQPLSDCIRGMNVVKILEAAETSIKNKGKEVIF